MTKPFFLPVPGIDGPWTQQPAPEIVTESPRKVTLEDLREVAKAGGPAMVGALEAIIGIAATYHISEVQEWGVAAIKEQFGNFLRKEKVDFEQYFGPGNRVGHLMGK